MDTISKPFLFRLPFNDAEIVMFTFSLFQSLIESIGTLLNGRISLRANCHQRPQNFIVIIHNIHDLFNPLQSIFRTANSCCIIDTHCHDNGGIIMVINESLQPIHTIVLILCRVTLINLAFQSPADSSTDF